MSGDESSSRATPPAELRAGESRHRVLEAPETEGRVLLAIDTALGTSVAIGAAGRAVEVVSDDPMRHAEAIGELLAEAFERSGADPSSVTGVAVGVGPGPFTGLRVGIAAAHAFAVARGVPVLPLQGHEAAALALLDGPDAREPEIATDVRIVQDARRRELFVTEFSGIDEAGIPVRSAGPRLVARAEYASAAAECWPERIPAARLVQLAARRIAAARGFEPDRALYLRAPDVKQPGAAKRVGGPSRREASTGRPGPRTAAVHGAQRGTSR